MSTPSAVPALIDALVAALTGAFPSTVLVAGFPVQVFDGVGNTDQDTGRQVWVGLSDPSQDGPSESATASQTWPYASGAFRRQNMTVWLTAQAWTGSSDPATVKTMRDAAYQIMAVVITAVMADQTLGGAVLMVTEPGGQEILRQLQDDHGCLAQVAFTVSAMQQFQN